jgi:hypothetical protein
MGHITDALACTERALALARDLDKVRDSGSLSQIASGLRRELDCAIQRLSDARDAMVGAATNDHAGKVRNDALATSRAAALAVTRPGSKRAEVLLALYRFGDLTDYEIQERLKMDPNTERPRRGELVDAQLVAPAVRWPEGEPRSQTVTREHKGRQWQVWTLTAAGVEAALQLAIGTEAASASRPETLGAQQLF